MASFVTHRLAVLVTAGTIAIAPVSAAQTSGGTKSAATSQPVIDSQPWTGDFDGMIARRRIRLLVPYSRTLFFVENGKTRGLTAELAHDFETYLNQKHAKELGGQRITIDLIPTTRDKLLSGLTAGMGDISGGNLTATESRMKVADFVAPTERDPAHEVLVSRSGAPAVATVDDLSGKKVNVRQASSYHESLLALNGKLIAAGKPAVEIVAMPDALEDEDLFEMLNAGLFDFMVVDSWKAKLWAQVAPQIKVHDDIVLRNSGTIGWAIRKQSPKLQAEIDGFYKTASQQGLIESRLTGYHETLRQIAQTYTGPASGRFGEALTMYRKYGSRYSVDALMLADAGFQESQLNEAAATGAQTAPAGGDPFERNVQAASKYVDQLMAKNFPDAKFSAFDRTMFAFASYKAGPDKIALMRTEAAKRGLDPNQWFNNVEQVTAEKLGMETTAYVRNIMKYDVAYKLMAGQPEVKN